VLSFQNHLDAQGLIAKHSTLLAATGLASSRISPSKIINQNNGLNPSKLSFSRVSSHSSSKISMGIPLRIVSSGRIAKMLHKANAIEDTLKDQTRCKTLQICLNNNSVSIKLSKNLKVKAMARY
jgi:hypothetical protein